MNKVMFRSEILLFSYF